MNMHVQTVKLGRGRKISEPGIYALSIDAYHGQPCAGPSISSSGLRTIFRDSPAHYWSTSSLNHERIEKKDSEAFALGRAAHHLLLGEDDFSILYVVRPDKWDNWLTNSAKAWRKEQEEEGRTVLIPSQIEVIRGMARALAAHPLIKAGILNGEIERSFIWKDEATGVWCKARPDAIPNWSGDFADLKTTTSVRTKDLERAIADYAYHQQAALIGDGYAAVTGNALTSFSLVFVEKAPPYCVRVVTLKDGDLVRGRRQNNAALKIFATCLRQNVWPGPGRADAEYIEMPLWEQERIDFALKQMGAD